MPKRQTQRLKPHQHLKRWFIPHKHNDHRPYLTRIPGLAVFAVLILCVQFTAAAVRPPDVRVLAYATDITPADLLTQTNQQRAAAGVPALHMDARLNQSAALKAQNMFAEDYWAHVSPSGLQPWHWFTAAGYNYAYAGENLAKDFDTTSGTMQGWMNSEGHRENILNPNYTDVGFAVENGVLQGGETTLVVAHYGSVAGVAVTATVAPPTPKPAVKAVTATPTPVPVAAATPTPTLTPAATATPSPKPVARAQSSPGAPPQQGYSLFRPLSVAATASWPTLVTIILLIGLLIVFVATHLAVWRKGLRRWRSPRYRLFAAAQVSGLFIAVIVLAASGFGQVG